MSYKTRIAAYTRISVDLELDKDNASIENQKAIIDEYCRTKFPTAIVDYYEDRDHSGYTFEQRPGYMSLRPKLLAGEYDILIVKDLSRFSRRTGKGLAEFEDLCEHDLRIIAIGDDVDYPTRDDWMKIKLYFFVNEMPVTDASRKVTDVINNRQKKGEWICAIPYGYVMSNSKKMVYEVDEPAAEVVREIFRLYIDGWGYKKIANHLTEKHIPTPRMHEKMRKEAAGEEYKGKVRPAWSIITISEILENDFYIGTLRQRKYHRKKINGADMKLDESENIVFENHHDPIVDYRVFKTAQELLRTRSTNHYRGMKKYDNVYSGFLFCGDCGSPMFSMSRPNLAEAYRCGAYHLRGRTACTSHHIRADLLDDILKSYIRKVRDNSSGMIKILEEMIANEKQSTAGGKCAVAELQTQIEKERTELRVLMQQKARDIARAKGDPSILEETYDALIAEAKERIEGLSNQIALIADNNNSIVRINRIAKTVIDIFNDILQKDKLEKNDLSIIIDRIIVYEDHMEVRLQADVDELLRTGTIEMLRVGELAANFNRDTENIEKTTEVYEMVAVQSAEKRRDKVFRVNVISNGDPLEIYTDREGEVIFKKYSPIGELMDFAAGYAETLYKTCNMPVVVCDKDCVIACAGISKKEFLEKKISQNLENIIEGRSLYTVSPTKNKIFLTDDTQSYYVSCAMPIFAEGDVIGCVVSVGNTEGKTEPIAKETETKLIQTAAGFLGRQLEA